MKCREVNKRIVLYLDNEVTGSERSAIEHHLGTCADCRKELESLAVTRDSLQQSFQALNEETVPAWIWVEVRQRLAISGSAGTSLLEGMMSRIRTSLAWQPRWRLVLTGALAVILVTVSSLFLPSVLRTSPEVLAGEIVRDASEVRALAGGEPSVHETKLSGTTGYVLSEGLSGAWILACVDVRARMVVSVFILSLPPLTDQERDDIADVVRSDRSTEHIMDRGGAIEDVFLLSPLLRLELVDGEPVVWSEGVLAGVTLREPDRMWIARVNTALGRVTEVTGFPPMPFPATPEAPAGKYTEEELVGIAEMDPRVAELLDNGAEVMGVAVGVRRMADSASVILRMEDEVWVVRIDLNAGAVSSVAPVPTAGHARGHFFRPGP